MNLSTFSHQAISGSESIPAQPSCSEEAMSLFVLFGRRSAGDRGSTLTAWPVGQQVGRICKQTAGYWQQD